MEHPKTIGDRSTLAIMLRASRERLRPARPVRREHALRPRHRRRRASRRECSARRAGSATARSSSRRAAGTATTRIRSRAAATTSARSTTSRSSAARPAASTSFRSRTCRRARTATLRVEPPRNRQRQVRPLRRAVRDRDVALARDYARTWRSRWWFRIFRLTRCSALSIVFVSQPSSSAISSYERALEVEAERVRLERRQRRAEAADEALQLLGRDHADRPGR